MEFSWNYEDTMRRLVTQSSCMSLNTHLDVKNAHGYSLMLKFSFKGPDGEVPTFAFAGLSHYFLQPHEEVDTFVLPLYMGNYHRSASGAETIIKYFTRSNDGRLNKAVTPKGEIYYGNNGMILDKDFNPLLLSTINVSFNPETNRLDQKNYVIHLTPKVFTDDDKLLNKSLAKKGIAYYLSHNSNTWGNNGLPYKVVIDDCSDYFVRAQRPNVNNCSDGELNKVLKENIDEVLRQISDDVGRVIW